MNVLAITSRPADFDVLASRMRQEEGELKIVPADDEPLDEIPRGQYRLVFLNAAVITGILVAFFSSSTGWLSSSPADIFYSTRLFCLSTHCSFFFSSPAPVDHRTKRKQSPFQNLGGPLP